MRWRHYRDHGVAPLPRSRNGSIWAITNMLQVFEETEGRFNRSYEMKRLGYDLKKVEARVCGIFKIESDDINSASREKLRTKARGLFCYWAVRELGYVLTDLGKRLGMTQPGVGYAVKRGDGIVKNKYQLENFLFIYALLSRPMLATCVNLK